MLLIRGSGCAFLLGLSLTFAVRAMARRAGVVAAPRQDRWHRKPTAILGGVAIYAAFLLAYLFLAPGASGALPILAAGTILFVTGLIDDLNQIKPYTKLIAQLIAAAVVVHFNLRLTWTPYEAVNDVITIFWLVGITNAINLLDNMDGLAGGISVISCVFLVITFLLNGQTNEAVLPALLAGAALGFLAYNFNPASIFMGDCGSMFLGFMLGGMALMSNYGRSRNVIAVVLTPVLILLIPIFDTCVVTVTRKLSGRRVSQGGRDHTSHRLVGLGISERRAVLLLYLFASSSGALATMIRLMSPAVILTLVSGYSLILLFLGLYLAQVRVYEQEARPSGNTIIRVFTGFSHKRRIFEVLLDFVLIALAYCSAYLFRWDGDIPNAQLAILMRTLPLVVLIQMPFFLLCGIYHGLWRYMGVDDLIKIAKSALLGMSVSAVVIFTMYNFKGPSRGVFVLTALLLSVYVGASRLSFRLLRVLIVGRNHSIHPDARPVLIYGADDGGELLVREILNNPGHRYAPIGFIDDDAHKVGKIIHGCRIFNIHQLPDLIQRHGVNDVLVSSTKVSEDSLEDLRNMGVCLRRMSIRIE